MDNISHSLTGLALGELVERSLPAEPDPDRARTRHRLLLVSCCAASNFPDLDLVLTGLAPRPLGYLLHHRGHTHTLLGEVPQALLLMALIWLLWPAARRLMRESRTALWATIGAICLGLLLHIGMDFLNVYGVHPFYPFDNRWVYGDLVFIVEPVFWIAFGAPLASLIPSSRWRRVAWLLLAAAPILVTALGFLQWGSLALLAAAGISLTWMARAAAPRSRHALAGGLAVALLFVGTQATAEHAARTLVQSMPHAGRLLDAPLSAFPANPLCWSVVTVEQDDAAGSYRLRRGLLSLAPKLVPASSCPARVAGPAAATEARVAWQWDSRQPLAAVRELRRDDCRVDAWLRFARAPSLEGGLATDQRWRAPGGANFTTLPLRATAGAACPAHLPDWGYPRADLLGLQPRKPS
jgi:inner membrane protein